MTFARALALVPPLALLLFAGSAAAGNRYSDCGGNGQRACCAFPEFRLPSCDSGLVEYIGGPGAGGGPLGCSLGTCYTPTFPSACGREAQRPCTIFEHIPSCMTGLVEIPLGVRCTLVDSGGFPNFCGDEGERPCTLVEHIPSCKPNLIEAPLLERCTAIDAQGYPTNCGDLGEPACSVVLQIQLGITSCKSGLFEAGFPFAGTCQAPSADGFPSYCGHANQPACSIIDQVALGIPPCRTELVEQAGIPVGTCRPIDDEGWPEFCGDDGEPPCTLELQTATGNPSCKPGLYEQVGLPSTCEYTPVPEPGLSTTAVVAPTPPGTPVSGIADLHAHPFSNEGFGGQLLHGKPFYRYGVAGALDACTHDHGSFGLLDLIGNELDNGNPVSGHEVGGYPGLEDWPGHDRGTHQQMYHRWIERAFRGGLRLLVVHAVNNSVICAVAGQKKGFTCDDMDAVDRELARAWEMQSYIDAQSGGPGQGWFRIATSAAQARQIIESGKLAVVLGIEVDALFRCPVGQCNATHVRSEVARYQALGVRHVFPVHVFDNAFGGAALYHGEMFNVGNRFANGQWFQAFDCSADGYEYQEPLAIAEPWLTLLSFLPFALTPAHGPADAHCNARGLTPLGDTLLRELMAKKMIIDVDHMSSRTLDSALDLFESQDYPVVAGHAWFLDTRVGDTRSEGTHSASELRRIRDLGGVVGAILNQGKASELTGEGVVANDCDESAKSWAQAYLYAAGEMQGGPGVHAIGIGSDLNGFLHLPAPRYGPLACKGNAAQAALQPASERVVYPFPAHVGTGSFERLSTGTRTWDVNEDGMANVGLLPDFVEELRVLGLSDTDLEPLFRSAEAYLAMWERVDGSADFDADGRFDAVDSCPTIADAGADADGDGVGDACDTCIDRPNPRFTGNTSNRTLVSGQLDDDADGRGNACDFDYNQGQAVVGAPDTNLFVAALNAGRTVNDNLCGAGGTSACGIHDHSGGQTAIGAPDTNFYVAMLHAGTTSLNSSPNRHCGVLPAQRCAQNPDQPCCPPFSRAIGSVPGPTLGKVTCQNPTGTGAPQRCGFAN